MGTDPEVAPDADSSAEEVEIRKIHPYQATKYYLCPGCNQDIVPGLAHLVVVPLAEPDLRRHWHTPCWEHRHRRRPGRIV